MCGLFWCSVGCEAIGHIHLVLGERRKLREQPASQSELVFVCLGVYTCS